MEGTPKSNKNCHNLVSRGPFWKGPGLKSSQTLCQYDAENNSSLLVLISGLAMELAIGTTEDEFQTSLDELMFSTFHNGKWSCAFCAILFHQDYLSTSLLQCK